jgi:hypothetical protein
MANEMKAFYTRWQAVAEVERQELQTTTLALRWKQLNAIIGMAIGLGINKPSENEIEVFQKWTKLKEKASSQNKVA